MKTKKSTRGNESFLEKLSWGQVGAKGLAGTNGKFFWQLVLS